MLASSAAALLSSARDALFGLPLEVERAGPHPGRDLLSALSHDPFAPLASPLVVTREVPKPRDTSQPPRLGLFVHIPLEFAGDRRERLCVATKAEPSSGAGGFLGLAGRACGRRELLRLKETSAEIIDAERSHERG